MRALLAVLVLTASGAVYADPVRIRVGTITPEGSPYFDAAKGALQRIAANSSAAVEFRIIAGGALGDEPTLMEEVRSGILEGAAVTATGAEALVPELSVFSLPFLFRDGREADEVIQHVFPQLVRLFEKRGLWLVAHTTVGFRHIGSQHVLRTMGDLRKVVPRSQPGLVQARMWELAGVKHHPLGQLEVMPELEAGHINGFDGSVPWIFGAAWHLKIKHLTLTGHTYQPGFMFLGRKGQSLLPKGLKREALMAGVLAVCRQGILASRKVDDELTNMLPGLGVAVDLPPPELMSPLREALMPLHAEWKRSASPDGLALFKAIERKLEQLRRR